MKKLIIAAITATVVIIVLAGCLMPVMEDATATSDTFTNDGMWRMAPNTNGDTYTYDNTTKEWSLNGTVVNSANSSNLSVILLDNTTVRSNGWLRGSQIIGNSVTTVVTNANDQTIISGNGLTGSGTFDIQGYGINPDGEYLLSSYTTPVYMNGDSGIYATGVTAINTLYNAVFHIEGSIKDGVTITSYVVLNSGYTVTDVVIDDVVINYTTVNGYVDLYKLSGITFNYSCTATNTSTSETTTVTDVACSYSSYVVPYEVTAERAVHFTDSENAILGIVPVMLIIALLVAIVALVIRNREM